LKEGGADKTAIAPAVEQLLALKCEYEEVTGEPFDYKGGKGKGGGHKKQVKANVEVKEERGV
ncbi:unnamed protein product, partial [Discosporangium mesarthrocarpum]